MNEMKASLIPGAQSVSGGLISLGSSKTPKMSINNEAGQVQSMINFIYNPIPMPSQSFNSRYIPAARPIQNNPGANSSSIARNQVSPLQSLPPNEQSPAPSHQSQSLVTLKEGGSGGAADAIFSVREFQANHHMNGVSQSVLKVRMHMTHGKGATKEVSHAVRDEEEQHEIDALRKQIVKGELVIKQLKLTSIPRALLKTRFDQITQLDIRGNDITCLDEGLFLNVTQLRRLDVRANKIREISTHIKALMTLQFLRLDFNLLEELPIEIGELCYLEELTFQDNKVKELPATLFSKLTNSLRHLNMSDNRIKHLPAELGNLKQLEVLYLHGNRFTNFPCTFAKLLKSSSANESPTKSPDSPATPVLQGSLQELSLEWFLYAKPPRPRLVKRGVSDGDELLEMLLGLCNLLVKYKMNECAMITFLENYTTQSPTQTQKDSSPSMFNIDHTDNRQRTPLHNACVKGDVGVVEGLLMGKANPNLLDKDNCTPLCLAIREDKFDAAVILINSPNVDVNMGGGIFGSPMHLAVVKLEVWVVKKLLMRGADVNKADCDGNTPMHLVMNVFSKNAQKCLNICELLITHGARANIKNCDNWAPLHIAARKGQEKGIQTICRLNQMLKEQGHQESIFDLNVTGGVQQWTALHLSAHGGHFQIVKDLITAGADIFQRNSNNHLPRHCAKGNYILTKYMKLLERTKARSSFQTIHVGTQYELLQGVTIKHRVSHVNHSSLFTGGEHSRFTRKMSEVTKSIHNSSDLIGDDSQHYDTFQQTLAQLKMSRTFLELDMVKRRWIFENYPEQNSGIPSTQPQIKHRAIKQMPAVISKNDFPLLDQLDMASQSDSRFSKLNQKAEEMKKVNLFYLKDILIKSTASYDEKLECLWKIKRNVMKPVFAMAMRALIQEFPRIGEPLIQRELLSAIACSTHCSLVQPLRDLLKSSSMLDSDIIDDVEDTIQSLLLVQQKPQSYIIQQIREPDIEDLKATTPLNLSAQALRKPEKSRNVNSFKMKGMTTILLEQQMFSGQDIRALPMPQPQEKDNQQIQYQLLETEVLEDNFTLPKHLQYIQQRSLNASLPNHRQVLANMQNQQQKPSFYSQYSQNIDRSGVNGAVRQSEIQIPHSVQVGGVHQHQFSMTMCQNKPIIQAAPQPFKSNNHHSSVTPNVYNTAIPVKSSTLTNNNHNTAQTFGAQSGYLMGTSAGAVRPQYQNIINANIGQRHHQRSSVSIPSKK